eukprot:15347962-Alexandrium_andersonii.AAC.1
MASPSEISWRTRFRAGEEAARLTKASRTPWLSDLNPRGALWVNRGAHARSAMRMAKALTAY